MVRRKANIDAACRIALRLATTGRGSDAGLAFLERVTARELGHPTTIVRTSAHRVGARHAPAASWSTPIVMRSGALVGEVRVAATRSRDLTAADVEALATVAEAAARILVEAHD